MSERPVAGDPAGRQSPGSNDVTRVHPWQVPPEQWGSPSGGWSPAPVVPEQPTPASPVPAPPAQPVGPPPEPVVEDPSEPFGPSWQPRIIPSPPPQRGRLVLGLTVGLLAGLIVFGTSGFLIGSQVAGSSTPPTPAPSGVGAPASLSVYETSQLERNRQRIDGSLLTFAEPWLPYLGGCVNNTEPNGPKLSAAQRIRLFCEYGGINVHFAEYLSTEERDKDRLSRNQDNIDARQLSPGVVDPSTKAGSSDHRYTYVEWAQKDDDDRTVVGIWWDDPAVPVAGWILVPWTGIGERWEPLRDVWQRHS